MLKSYMTKIASPLQVYISIIFLKQINLTSRAIKNQEPFDGQSRNSVSITRQKTPKFGRSAV